MERDVFFPFFPLLTHFSLQVLGGLAWAISGSAVDVDVDVFFDDGASLGEKNKCAEDVCRALIRMKSPHKLQSFQITRSDWKNVHTVVVWVIKTVLESREENEKQMRRLALFKAASLPGDLARAQAAPAAKARLAELETLFGPRRRFRRTNRRKEESENERVQNVLREYGMLGGGARGAGNDAASLDDAYSSWKGQENISGSVVGQLLGTDDLKRFRNLYEESQHSQPESQAQLSRRLHQQKVAALNARQESGAAELISLKRQHSVGAERLSAMQAALEQRRQANESLATELAAFRRKMAESEFAETVKELQRLVALNETLKTHMSQFEESCRRQAEELRAKVVAMRGGLPTHFSFLLFCFLF